MIACGYYYSSMRSQPSELEMKSKQVYNNFTHENSHALCGYNMSSYDGTTDIVSKEKVCAVDHYKTFNDTSSQTVSSWPQHLAESSTAQLQVTPAIVCIRSGIKDYMFLQSNDFYVFNKKEKYLVNMRVYLNGHGDSEGTHISIYLFTKDLETGTCTIELHNQVSDSDHYSVNLTFGTNLPSEGINGIKGWGMQKFVSHKILLQSSSYYHYYKNDTAYFRVSYHVTHRTAPVVLELHNFTKKKKAFNEEYQMFSRVDGAGKGDDHLSVYLHLMKGPHDDQLEQSGHWPLRGTFTIELLNRFDGSDL